MRVTPIPALADNYAWLLVEGNDAVVVDPSEAAPVLDALGDLRLVGIWCTHHHLDHVGGIPGVLAARGPVEVVGRDPRRVSSITRSVREGDTIAFGDTRILEVPGHTLDALAFLTGSWIFSGDTLFAGGCGRVFEETMPMMRDSLAKLRDLPGKLCCGHEYTVNNLRFARSVGLDVDARLAREEARRARGEPTVPADMDEERATNPFLRWDDPGIVAWAAGEEPFTTLREAKNRW